MQLREHELIKLKQENAKFIKSHEHTARKYAVLEESKSEAEEEIIRLKYIHK